FNSNLGRSELAFGFIAEIIMEGILMNIDKSMAAEVALEAMDQFMKMARNREEIFWLQGHDNRESLNYKEYMKQFGIGPRLLDYKTDATRETAKVFMKSLSLVETLMNMNQWTEMFCCLVSRAITIDVISSGVSGTLNGALLLMYAELQVLSPLVSTREVYFLRFCKQHEEGVWAVVDVTVDSLTESPSFSLPKCRKRPSGCLIQDMPNGYSKVTWVEHWEYDDSEIHGLYRSVIGSGMAFGAQRWLATLQRQSERLATVLANPHLQNMGSIVAGTVNGCRSLLKLAERMTNSFCSIVNASTMQRWSEVSGLKDSGVRVATRKRIDDPGEPPAVVLSAATSVWLPVSSDRLFEFLRDERFRNEWDILSSGGPVQEMAYIATGQDPGNSVSLLKVQSNTLILQESCKDSSGFLVVYSPVDNSAANEVMNGKDSSYVSLLPSGFSILPDGPETESEFELHIENGNVGGALLTVIIQVLVSTNNPPKARLTVESVKTVNNLISHTVHKIKSALS
ncbi:hypothetical protein KI387_035134, partial [Taxus chinensis]